jgi:hypothetical protein
LFACLAIYQLHAVEPAPGATPNSHPAYVQLRNVTLGGESVSVNNLILRRDAGTLQLRSGPVEG